jgi:hypothetical protein
MANLYRVHYGFFSTGGKAGKLVSEEKYQDVLAADGNEATIKAVFTSNGIARNGVTVEILSVRQANHAGANGFIQ